MSRLRALVESGIVDKEDGTILDTTTNLLWQQSHSEEKMCWEEAKEYCKSLTLAGHSDWRLPTIEELETLIDKKYKPSIDPIFKCNPDWYWSSSTYDSYPDDAWLVYFDGGNVNNDNEVSGGFVRAVRDV
jgi:hypothetical protein